MKRTEALDVRVTAEEKNLIRAAATKAQRSMSDFVRLAALEKALETEMGNGKG